MVAATVEPVTKSRPGQGANGRFLPGNSIAKGNALCGRAEKMRALLLQTAEKRIGEVLDVLFDLAINERQAWAICVIPYSFNLSSFYFFCALFFCGEDISGKPHHWQN